MDKVEKLKLKLKELSKEEMEQLKQFLESEEVAVEPETPMEESVAETQQETEENTEEVVEDKPQEQEEPKMEEVVDIVNELPEKEAEPETPKPEKEGADVEEDASEETVEEEQEEEAIPQMQKGAERGEEEEPSAVLEENNEEPPIDFEQIIEAQQAKISALQAENASLKNKVEGAFGYSAKPASSVKVNRLYDDAADLHFHK